MALQTDKLVSAKLQLPFKLIKRKKKSQSTEVQSLATG